MKIIPLISSSWPFPLILIVCLCTCCCTPFISCQCLNDQKSLLLELKHNLTFAPDALDKLVGWNQSTDCCQWNGVTCNNSNGRVIGLDLSDKGITGGIDNSSSLFRLQFLQMLNLANNNFLQGEIPSIIDKLRSLEELDVSSSNSVGVLPSSISNLKRLRIINLSNNKFSGPIPSFSSMKNLKSLHLQGNNLNGSINTTNWDNLFCLEELDLSYNSLDGSISSITSPKISSLQLNNNNFEGSIPNSIFQLREIQSIDLSSNKLNGTLHLANILQSFKNLTLLGLSHNRLSVDTNGCEENSSFPQLETLLLASCNLLTIPKFLQNQTSLRILDLSVNYITGVVPRWIWRISEFNLSSNHLVELEPPLTLPYSIRFIDLHSNNLQGKFPVVTSNYHFLDCSNNNFTSIDPYIVNYLSKANYVSFSRNNLYGSIPTSLCNATNLELLNLLHNQLSGTIPDCFIAMTQLKVLNLRGNKLDGEIPAKFRKGCSLQTLDLNGNFMQGRIPRSLSYCKSLKVLDLGNNQLSDTFPCHLKSLSDLQVLVLRSNKFYGAIVCPKSQSMWPLLQIVDIASNHFTGELRSQVLFKWTSMMARTTKERSLSEILKSTGSDGNNYYQNSVALTFKGLSYELQYILITFTSIDFSNNAFHGKLPQELGNLNALVVLNLSHNSFFGHIPSSIGNLSQIESLDLSCNNLCGNIPMQLAGLYFLEYLNLSFNKLSGEIPLGSQLQLFNASSYEGNQGLHGPPLTPIRRRHKPDEVMTPSTSSQGSYWNLKSQIDWMLKDAEVGFSVGITIFIGPILYIKRYREWYSKHLHKMVMKILRKEDNSTRRMKRRKRNQQRHRR